MVSHLKIIKKLTSLTQFSREWLKKAKNGGLNSKWLAHIGKLLKNAEI